MPDVAAAGDENSRELPARIKLQLGSRVSNMFAKSKGGKPKKKITSHYQFHQKWDLYPPKLEVYPLLIKDGNGRTSENIWFSMVFLLRPPVIGDFQLPCLIAGGIGA